MGLIFLFRRLVFAQVLLAIVAFCMAEGNPGMLLIAGALGALSWYVVEGPTGRPLPQWVILPGAVLALCWLMPDLYWQRGNVIVAMGHFIMWLQVLLLYSKKTNRQYAELLALSLMQIVSAGVVSTSMIFALLLLAYCVIALCTILLFQLKVTSDEVMDANQAAASRPVEAVRPKAIVGRGHRWHFRFTAMGIGVSCGLIAMAFFLVTPRSRRSMLNSEFNDPNAAAHVGFVSTIQLNGTPLNNDVQSPVLNLQLSVDGKPVTDSAGPWLLRGVVLDFYYPPTRTWTRSGVDRYDRLVDLPRGGAVLAAGTPGLPVVEGVITTRMLTERTLFAFGPVLGFQCSGFKNVFFNDFDQQLTASVVANGPFTYSFKALMEPQRSMDAFAALSGRSPAPPATAPYAAGVVFPDQYAQGWTTNLTQVRQWALNVLKQVNLTRDPGAESTPRDLQIAQALASYMQTKFRYTLLNPLTARREDPIADFLLKRQEGHCELFASGLAAALRSIGMRARVVSGFRVGEYNSVGGYFVVRQNNAHAWTEAFCGDNGWVTLDATPPTAVAEEHRPAGGVLGLLRNLYEYLDDAWMSKIVSYDSAVRDRLMQSTGQSLKQMAQDKNSWLGWFVDWLRSLPSRWQFDSLTYTIMGVILFFILVGVASLVRILVVRARRLAALQLNRLPGKERRRLAGRLRFYLQMLDVLERHGYIRPDWQSPFSFAQELADANPNRFDPVVALTEIFYEVRFGHRQLDQERHQKIRAHLSQLEAALAGRKK